tara:strand:+ start:3776 stop:4579 length:804 start_codon:yes stop_codon:yes gene_type:complete
LLNLSLTNYKREAVLRIISILKFFLFTQVLAVSFSTSHAWATGNHTVDGTWDFAIVKMQVSPPNGFEKGKFLEMLEAAIAPWNVTGAGPVIELSETDVEVTTPAFDGMNSIFIHPNWEWDPGLLALTFTHVDKASQTILEADIALNPDHNWVYEIPEDDATAFDLQSAFAHEFGHVLGIPDLKEFPDATMFGEIQSFEDKKRDLNVSDEECMRSLYEGKELTEPFDPNADYSGGGGGCQSTDLATPLASLGLLVLLRRKRSTPHTHR